ncbi:DUF2797 domain-containing protein [Streptomyces sp. NBC_01497]|nr:DUF2797 domain-containing protein [Streptomyces sp. NBC_01497]
MERLSELVYGREVAFRAVGPRRCTGTGRGGCPLAAEVPARSTGAQCSECARLDRLRSVAADTVADDPRPYRVYLAWFGPGMRKVGITAEARGSARLLEQGAVTFSWLGRGPLMAARRTEELLRAALGVPDRIPYADKRTARASLPPERERAAELAALHARAVALPRWPESLEPLVFEAVDHARVFGLERPPAPGPTPRAEAMSSAGSAPAPDLAAAPDSDSDASPDSSRSSDPGPARPGASIPPAVPVAAVVTELVDGGGIAGRLVAVAGPDLHLAVAGKGVVVVDSRLMRGWGLERLTPGGAAAGEPLSLPAREIRRDVQGGLF